MSLLSISFATGGPAAARGSGLIGTGDDALLFLPDSMATGVTAFWWLVGGSVGWLDDWLGRAMHSLCTAARN